MVNAGNGCPTTDQRNYSRNGTCDKGATEYNGTAPTPPPPSGSTETITKTYYYAGAQRIAERVRHHRAEGSPCSVLKSPSGSHYDHCDCTPVGPAEHHTEHPHIVLIDGVPTLRGMRLPVRLIAQMYRAGDTVDDLLHTYPHLHPATIHDALSYYLDHRDELEREIAARLQWLTPLACSSPSTPMRM